MSWERAIGPGWGDPLLGQAQAQVGGGASPLLILAILVGLAALLYYVTHQEAIG